MPTPNDQLRLSERGATLIQLFEGYRAVAYRDAVGIWTIGWGHTRTAKPGMTISEAEGARLFRDDIRVYEIGVGQVVRVPLNQNEFDALVSFAYNVGVGALRASTLVRLLNDGAPRATVALQFERWAYAGGTRLQGLARRRTAEAELFMTEPLAVSPERLRARPDAPDGPLADLPILRAPFVDTLATRVLDGALNRLFAGTHDAPLSAAELIGLEATVRQFQGQQELLVDGVVGPDTWRTLFQAKV